MTASWLGLSSFRFYYHHLRISVYGNSMFRIIDPPSNFKHSTSEWIYKMLFLWSREPTPDPRASPWFAWFATAVLLWRCRRRITKAILAISPLRLLKRRATGLAINQKMILKQQKRHSLAQLHKHKTVGIRRAKRLCTGDGPHMSDNMSMISQIHYRVTRSGRIYGKYPNKTAIPNGIQESH
ncbi:PREDICTED: uncharacterized protein LOC108747873 isoform X1 [Trachymyrmex septentrionalis]|uniref:uncharacterized protein LOC108747873 isoform X1 n=2 Tax=Trachymyrmex septentrionalis TaxID=34720 RepID=UPI00084F40B9|nr:PREDICTED: uncharacterized protein LOC108747873 isoform X1 [Trachymyrmex septentrionalis]